MGALPPGKVTPPIVLPFEEGVPKLVAISFFSPSLSTISPLIISVSP